MKFIDCDDAIIYVNPKNVQWIEQDGENIIIEMIKSIIRVKGTLDEVARKLKIDKEYPNA